MKLIKADDVFEWYVKAFDGSGAAPKIEPNEVRFSMNDIAANLANIPAVDAVQVKRGKWIIGKFGNPGKCSVCGMHCGEYDLENWDRYCSCCGALMEGLERQKNERH